jgi:hypothetical protein
MASCKCENSREYRITGEFTTSEDGREEARLRCVKCGGKVAYIPVDWLAETSALDHSDLKAGRVLSEDEQLTITVDLI